MRGANYNYANTDTDTCANSYSLAYPNANASTCAIANSYTCADPNAYAYCGADSEADFYACSYANAYTDTRPEVGQTLD